MYRLCKQPVLCEDGGSGVSVTAGAVIQNPSGKRIPGSSVSELNCVQRLSLPIKELALRPTLSAPPAANRERAYLS